MPSNYTTTPFFDSIYAKESCSDKENFYLVWEIDFYKNSIKNMAEMNREYVTAVINVTCYRAKMAALSAVKNKRAAKMREGPK